MFLVCLSLLSAGSGLAQTVTWINDADGNWGAGSNWSTGQPPAPGSNVVIDRGIADPTITLLDSFNVNSVQSVEAFSIGASGSSVGGALYLSAPSSFSGALMHLCCTLNSTSTIDVSGRLTVFNSVMSGSGTTTATGGIDMTGPLFWLLDGHKVVNSGVARVMANSVTTLTGVAMNISLGSTFTNLATGTFDIHVNTSITSTSHGSGAAGAFENYGLIKVSGGASAGIGLINNYGTIDVLAGGLSFAGTNFGVINAADGATLRLGGMFDSTSMINAGNARVLIGSATIAGKFNAGSVKVSGDANLTATNPVIGALDIHDATLRLNTGAPITVPSLILQGTSLHNDTNFSGGVRGGTDVLNVSGMFEWIGGTLVDSGTTNAFGGIVIKRGDDSNTGGKQLRGGHVLNNFATATWMEFDLVMNEGSIFNNKPGAVVDFTNNFGITHFPHLNPQPVFNNDGTLRKSGGDAPSGIVPTPSSAITVTFNNRGSVEVDSGLLRLTGGGTSTGSFTVAPGKAIEFAGGHVLQTTSSVNAASATVLFSSFSEDRVAGNFQAAKTQVTGSVAFTDNAPQLGILEVSRGQLRLAAAQASSIGVVNASGAIVIERESVLQLSSGTFLQTFGTTVVDGSLTTVLADIRSGFLAGSGAIGGSVMNGGVLRPGGIGSGVAGEEAGQFSILGDYEQIGLLEIGIGGHDAGIQHDLLSVSGHATLAGSLTVMLLNGFEPVAGDMFTIVTFLSRSGTLAFTIGASITPTLRFVPVYESDSLVLRVTAVPEANTWIMLMIGVTTIIGWTRRRSLAPVR